MRYEKTVPFNEQNKIKLNGEKLGTIEKFAQETPLAKKKYNWFVKPIIRQNRKHSPM